MGAKGFNLANDGHIVMGWGADFGPAHELNGADHHLAVVNMENWNHVDFVIYYGASPRAAGVITVESCSNWVTLAGAPTTATKIPFQYYRRIVSQLTMGNDVDSEIYTVAVAATGLVPEAGTPNDIMYIIPLDADQLISGHIGFRLDIVNAGAASLCTVVAICSGARYAGSARPTVMSV
jgi:hypothetical protein